MHPRQAATLSDVTVKALRYLSTHEPWASLVKWLRDHTIEPAACGADL